MPRGSTSKITNPSHERASEPTNGLPLPTSTIYMPSTITITSQDWVILVQVSPNEKQQILKCIVVFVLFFKGCICTSICT